MMKPIAAALGAAFLLSAQTAAAQPAMCAPRAQIVQALASQYGEHLLVQAPMDDGRLLEIYVAEDRSSWTAVAIVPLADVGCLIASGSAFELIAPGRNG
jgi:hypothetical protein